MFIKSIAIKNIKKSLLFILVLFCMLIIIFFTFKEELFYKHTNTAFDQNVNEELIEGNLNNTILNYVENTSEDDKSSYIKWVDFRASSNLLFKLANLDILSHNNNENIKFNWIELMAYLGCKYGGDLRKFKQSDLDNLISELKSGKTISDLTSGMKLYNYFFESYDAIFHSYIGEFTIQKSDKNNKKYYETNYGIKVFSPIAKNYSFSHYKDFGTSRSYGYKRKHLGNDLLR